MPEQLRPESKDLGEAATFTPNSSLLIPHSSFEQSFRTQSRDSTSPGLTLNPSPFLYAIMKKRKGAFP